MNQGTDLSKQLNACTLWLRKTNEAIALLEVFDLKHLPPREILTAAYDLANQAAAAYSQFNFFADDDYMARHTLLWDRLALFAEVGLSIRPASEVLAAASIAEEL